MQLGRADITGLNPALKVVYDCWCLCRALIAVQEQTREGGEPSGPERTSASGSSRGRNADNAYITWTASQKSTTHGPQASQDLQNFPPVDASQDLLGSEEAPLPLESGPPLLLELAGSQPLPLSLSCRPLADRVSIDPSSEPLALLPLQQDPHHQHAEHQQQQHQQQHLHQQEQQLLTEHNPSQLSPEAKLQALPPRSRNRPNPFAAAAALKARQI